MMLQISAKLAPIIQEFKNNQRLFLAGWLVLGILLGYVIFFVVDQRRLLAEEYTDLTERAAKIAFLAGKNEWLLRATAAKSVLVQLESKLMSAESPGLAQANVQTWLDDQLKTMQFTEAKFRVEQPVAVPINPGALQVTSIVEGPYDPIKVAKLLLSIEAGPQLMSVEQLDILNKEKRYFTLVIKTYFQGVGRSGG